MKKKIVAWLLCTLLLLGMIPTLLLADINAPKYEPFVNYAWKVSLYVGKSGTTSLTDDLAKDFYQYGGEAIILAPKGVNYPQNTSELRGNKVDLLASRFPDYTQTRYRFSPDWDMPGIPGITSGATTKEVSDFFGDTNTLLGCAEALAKAKGQTLYEPIADFIFDIKGTKTKLGSKSVYPFELDGKLTNLVPWVIVYEPMLLIEDKNGNTFAYTATDFAWAQAQNVDWSEVAKQKSLADLINTKLPDSLTLEKPWLGYSAPGPLLNNVAWRYLRMIYAGGWDMKFLPAGAEVEAIYSPNQTAEEKPQTRLTLPITSPLVMQQEESYRVSTEVITAIKVEALEDITPKEPAKATLVTSTEQKAEMDLTLPKGGDQLVWIKWRTPDLPGQVQVDVTLSGNKNLRFHNGSRKATITVNVVDWNRFAPEHPKADDPAPQNFKEPAMPAVAQRLSATWHTWSCTWQPKLVTVQDAPDAQGRPQSHVEDQGWYVYTKNNYYARLTANLKLTQGKKQDSLPFMAETQTTLETNADPGAATNAQNVLVFFPEFGYTDFARLKEVVFSGKNKTFQFQKNPYSPTSSRFHYVPDWYPAGQYAPLEIIMDAWTPAGMLTTALTENLTIQKGAK